LRIIDISPRHQRLQNIGQHLGVWARRHGAFLCTPQLGCGDHLHGLGDLPRVAHAADSPPDV
jgi:ABC-type transporter lipoprotein component MlaA